MKNDPMYAIVEDIKKMKPEDFHPRHYTEEDFKRHRRDDLSEAARTGGMEAVAKILGKHWDPVTQTMNRITSNGEARKNKPHIIRPS